VAGTVKLGRKTHIPTGYTSVAVSKSCKGSEPPVKEVIVVSTLNTLEFGVVSGVVPTPITVEAGVGMQILLIW
jgi:hypothetical protein